jgi:hypothetical protein
VLMGHDRNPILFGLSDKLTTVYQKGWPGGKPWQQRLTANPFPDMRASTQKRG